MALLQMRLNGNRGLFNIAEIGFTAFIERGGNANQNRVGLLELGKISGGAEVAAVHELLNLGLGNVLDIGLSRIEHGNFRGVSVKASDSVPGFSKANRQRKSYVTASDNSNFKLRTFEEFWFPFDRHL